MNYLFLRRLLGLRDGILATNDGDNGGHSLSDGYGDGCSMDYGSGSGDGWSSKDSYRLSSSSVYGDGDIYGSGVGSGYSVHSDGLS